MSPTVTIRVMSGFDSWNHGSFDATGVSHPIAPAPTWCATTVAPNGFDSEASISRAVAAIRDRGLADL